MKRFKTTVAAAAVTLSVSNAFAETTKSTVMDFVNRDSIAECIENAILTASNSSNDIHKNSREKRNGFTYSFSQKYIDKNHAANIEVGFHAKKNGEFTMTTATQMFTTASRDNFEQEGVITINGQTHIPGKSEEARNTIAKQSAKLETMLRRNLTRCW